MSEALSAYVARNMRAQRAFHGWRQADLAQHLGPGFSVGTISDMESGERIMRVDDLPRLCRAFGCTLADLTRGADPADLAALGLKP